MRTQVNQLNTEAVDSTAYEKGDPNKDPDYEYDFPDLTALEYCAQNENASRQQSCLASILVK